MQIGPNQPQNFADAQPGIQLNGQENRQQRKGCREKLYQIRECFPGKQVRIFQQVQQFIGSVFAPEIAGRVTGNGDAFLLLQISDGQPKNIDPLGSRGWGCVSLLPGAKGLGGHRSVAADGLLQGFIGIIAQFQGIDVGNLFLKNPVLPGILFPCGGAPVFLMQCKDGLSDFFE